MALSVNYPSPVFVNGYSCRNCTDVDYANKNIDPARPADGPFGVNADKHSALTDSKSAKQVFDRDKIHAAIAAASSQSVQQAGAAANTYGAAPKVETGRLVNLSA